VKRAAIGFLLALVAVGAYAWAQQCIHGDAVTDLRTIGAGGAVWGLYVVGDGFFASAALASLVVACVIRVRRSREMGNAAQIALLLGLAGLLASLGCVLADLGRPMAAMVNLPLFGRPRSPFFGTFTLVAGVSLFATVVHLALATRPGWAERAQTAWLWRLVACGWQQTASATRRRGRVDFWVSLALLPLFLGGLVILGVVFGVRAGRPAWQGEFEVVTFVVSGCAAGCSLLALATRASRQVSVPLARALAGLTGLTVLLVVSGEILALRTPYPSVQRYARALLDGAWSNLFWAELVLFFVAAISSLATWRKTASVVWAATTTLLVCTAVFIERFLVLVAWQTHGLGLPWPAGVYHPSGVEWSVLAGVVAAAVLVFLLLTKVCPAGTAASPEPAGPAPTGRRLRLLVTAACLILGLAAAGVGLALSAGLASAPFLDPILSGSPLIFLAGLFLMVLAPVAYELIPERKARGHGVSPPHLP
jgi:Ni/Fe-hydrogenase subunit HybB-like protein